MKPVRDDLFPKSLFFIYWGILLAMAGLHMGVIVLFGNVNVAGIIQIIVILIYSNFPHQ